MQEFEHDRVTNVISPFTGIEFIPEHILSNAAGRGTLTHACIEGILQGFEDVDVVPEVQPYLQSFKSFWEESSYTFEGGRLILERRLFCDEKMITGQVDLIIEMEDKTILIDWKTSSRPQKSWALQGAAYKYLAEINGFENVESILFVRLKKDGKPPVLTRHTTHDEDIETFFKCLELYRWFKMKTTRNKWETR